MFISRNVMTSGNNMNVTKIKEIGLTTSKTLCELRPVKYKSHDSIYSVAVIG